MNNQEKFEDTINILVKAYQNNTLQKGDCNACAVGNIIANKCGILYTKDLHWTTDLPAWQYVFMTVFGNQEKNLNYYTGKAKEQIDSTGYTWQQLAKIEFAFESAPEGKTKDEEMFNGLMAVVDVLMEMHKIGKEKESSTKSLFAMS